MPSSNRGLSVSSASRPAAASPPRLQFVNAARGYAILGVILLHCTNQMNGKLPPLAFLLGLTGQFGVQLFFVASAFTMLHSANQRAGSERYPLASFYLRRYFRIAPLYYAGIPLYYVIRCIADQTLWPQSYSWQMVAANLVFIHGWIPGLNNLLVPGGWSISAEFSFYMVFPFLLRWARSFGYSVAGAALSAGAAGFIYAFVTGPIEPGNGGFGHFHFASQLPVFFLGFCAHSVWLRRQEAQNNSLVDGQNSRHADVRIQCALLTITALALVIAGVLMFSADLAVGVIPALGGFGCLLFFFALMREGEVVAGRGGILVNRYVERIGELSYSLYLTHFVGALWLCPALLDRVLPGPAEGYGYFLTYCTANFIGTLALALGLSLLTQRFIEQPGIEWGRKLIRRFNAKPETQTAANVLSETSPV